MGIERVPSRVEELGNGLFGYVQGNGSWGWSNSGLVTSQGRSLLVDTLFTGYLTRDMLDAYRRAAPEAANIDILVNTHANGDHTFGNHLVEGARIVGSKACVEEMEERPAAMFQEIMRSWRDNGEAGAFLHEVMGSRFDFSDIQHVPPTETFSGRTDLTIGDVAVELHELGPAHTRGDIVAYVPSARTVFCGDVLFAKGHPIIWDGSIENWIAACDKMLSWDVETVVPGHGPIGDKAAVRALREYLVYVRDEAAKRYAAGMDFADAAWDIALTGFDDWLDRERVVVNVAHVYKVLSNGAVNPDRPTLNALMGRYRAGTATPHEALPAGGCGHHDHAH
ncbi:MBL fold metallo-hydrolase [Microbaculum marinum]|uniref:MBL fold metallo-hydrolase n=1 Tax=Microbaculum marinum TaxID=1764581 RepID=A0AAW9RT14_9HYPH